MFSYFKKRQLARLERERLAKEKARAEAAAQEKVRIRKEHEGLFFSLFDFEHTRISDTRFQKICLDKMNMIASRIDHNHTHYHLGRDYKEGYHQGIQYYIKALELIEYFDPEFAATIPFWKDLLRYSNEEILTNLQALRTNRFERASRN